MIQLVDSAERYLEKQKAWHLPAPLSSTSSAESTKTIAQLRKDVSACAGSPMIVSTVRNARTLSFARRADICISQHGPATPDHVIRTKRLPMLGRNVDAYAADYRKYFGSNAAAAKDRKTMLDAAPRVVLDAELGLCAV